MAGFLQASGGSWTALGRAGRGGPGWGSSAPHISHLPPGTSGLAQAGSCRGNSRDTGELAQPRKPAFKPLLTSHLLESHLLASCWPKQVSWAESVGQRASSSLDGKSCRGTGQSIVAEEGIRPGGPNAVYNVRQISSHPSEARMFLLASKQRPVP